MLDMRLDVSGLEHIEPGRVYVVAPLHEGFADAVALMRLPLDLRFVATQELSEWRVPGRHLRSTGQVVVRAESSRTAYRDMLRMAPSILGATASGTAIRMRSIPNFPRCVGWSIRIEGSFPSEGLPIALRDVLLPRGALQVA
ncbi:MAG TPA: hypothetical protein VFD97_01125 [Acidimicrobiia bacterium]|nr:hypothetical protein [Acidimicrobiia bacterium]